MRKETKRLLKCDLLYAFKDSLVCIPTVLGLWLGLYLLNGTGPNTVLLVIFVIAMILMAGGVKDWQVQIRLYISAGMTRKGVFEVCLMRNAAVVLVGFIIEAVIAFVGYPYLFQEKFFLLSFFYILFIWGYKEIAGVLVYQRKKLGQVLLIFGYLLVMMAGVAANFSENQEVFLGSLLSFITMANVLVVGAAAVMMFLCGIYFAGKQIKKYMVY